MTRDELNDLLRHPQHLSSQTLQPLRELLEAYPYCSSFAFLYLYNLALVEDVRYSSELRRLALHLPSRARLYSLVEGDPEPELEVGSRDEAPSPFDLIDSFLEQEQALGRELPSDLGYEGQSSSRDDYFASREGRELLETGEPLEPEADLPALDLSEAICTFPERTSSSSSTPFVQDEELQEELFTETLARIYIQQGHYEKALRIIRSISLNYPKKSLYFADQIRFLERLINNNKLR